MTKKTTRAEEYSGGRSTLFLVLELGWREWRLGFSTGLGQKLRSRRMPARDCDRLIAEIVEAKRRFAHGAGDSVIVEARYTGTYKPTGKGMDAQVCHVWDIKDGKVTRFQQYVDTAKLHDVMGVR